MADTAGLPRGVTVFERGWLSANNVLFQGLGGTALVDSGYCTHANQTVALVSHALGSRPLALLVNTHLHSDHCGGNAAIQHAHPEVRTLIPPGLADAVRQWDPVALTYEPTGQQCPRFRIEGVLAPGMELKLADASWQVHASPGHDAHSIILFDPVSRTLLSADALWENGFGIVFPELEGIAAFDEVAGTLDLIEKLAPVVVIPGHGAVFRGETVGEAIARARSRLSSFVANPARHASHAAKVLLKFKLLELQEVSLGELVSWAQRTPYFRLVATRYLAQDDIAPWVGQLLDELVRVGAAERNGHVVSNI